jgi:glucokinase-like ROK family protein
MARPMAVTHPDCPPGLVEVLDYVRRRGSCTRAQLVEATGLSRALVGQRLTALADYGLVAEAGVGPSTGGRAPRTVRFCADAGHLLVADLGATSIDVAVADLAGGILEHAGEPADIAAGPDVVLGRVEALFEECVDRVNPSSDLFGIGIGVPGPVEFDAGRPISPPIMPGWDSYSVPARFSRFGVPVRIDNDVNVMALGEFTTGLGRGRENFVFVKIGTGIGAGIIVNGELYRGSQGCAGDIGHIQIPVTDRGNVVCRCGNVNCLEALAGGAALARDGEEAARDGRSPFLRAVLDEKGALDARDVALGAAHGDATCVELISHTGQIVGQAVAAMVNFFNPSLVVIGGGVAEAGDGLLATIRQAVYRRSLPLSTRNLGVHRSTLGWKAGIVGAATMVANELFARDYLPARRRRARRGRSLTGRRHDLVTSRHLPRHTTRRFSRYAASRVSGNEITKKSSATAPKISKAWISPRPIGG